MEIYSSKVLKPGGLADNQATLEYCSGIDEAGYPRINTDVNCQAWCSTLAQNGNCATAMTKFCTDYPFHTACACMNFAQTPDYTNFIQAMPIKPCGDGVTLPCVNAQIPDPVCWAPVCTAQSSTDPNYPLKSSTMISNNVKCGDTTYCTEAINISDSNNIQIKNATFSQICGSGGGGGGGGGSKTKIGIVLGIIGTIGILSILRSKSRTTKTK